MKKKDQNNKTIEILNKSTQYVAKQYKINDENGPKEQKQKILEKKKINRQNTEGEKIESLSYKQRQKIVKVEETIEKSM